MKLLSCFAGIGGIDLGLEWAGMQTVGQIEIDENCTRVLEKHWPFVPRWSNIKEVDGLDVFIKCGVVDIIAGGFPCQDISVASQTAVGITGERSGLWVEMWRLVRYLRPRWVLFENVPALRTRGIDAILDEMANEGYAAWPLVVGAEHVGAPHKRHRVWIVGYSDSIARSASQMEARHTLVETKSVGTKFGCANLLADAYGNTLRQQSELITRGSSAPVVGNVGVISDTDSTRWKGQGQETRRWSFPAFRNREQHEWERPRTQSRVGSPTNGIPRRVALKMLGNSVVPQVVAVVGRAIMEYERLENGRK